MAVSSWSHFCGGNLWRSFVFYAQLRRLEMLQLQKFHRSFRFDSSEVEQHQFQFWNFGTLESTGSIRTCNLQLDRYILLLSNYWKFILNRIEYYGHVLTTKKKYLKDSRPFLQGFLEILGDSLRFLGIFGDLWTFSRIFSGFQKILDSFRWILWEFLEFFKDSLRFLGIFCDLWTFSRIFSGFSRILDSFWWILQDFSVSRCVFFRIERRA